MNVNYHTHTQWCHHGTGEIEEYILRGIEGGLRELAITEHVPVPNDWDPRRLQMSEFPEFNRELDRLILKYQGQIRVRKGLECEYNPALMDHYRSYRESFGYEIFILGHHNTYDHRMDYFCTTKPSEVLRYAEEVCQGLETGFFTFLAHPDVFMAGYSVYDDSVRTAMDRIFKVCERMKIPVEINANGAHYRRGYPNRQVWEQARDYDLSCLIGSDAHQVSDLICPSIDQCEAMAKELGLKVLYSLP